MRSLIRFTLEKNLNEITFINGDELKYPLSFNDFFDKYISSIKLSIDQSEYNSQTLLAKLLSVEIGQQLDYVSSDKTVKYMFSIQKNNSKFLECIIFIIKQIDVDSSDIDFLTKVHSRSYIVNNITKTLKDENFNSGYLIMVDLDNFKNINDSYGHLVGDTCLRTIATMLNDIFKEHIFGRYGGDEFIAFVMDVSKEQLKYMIDRVLKIEYTYNQKFKKNSTVTCSLGITSEIKENKDFKLLIKEADNALYKSKKLGKNIAFSSTGEYLINSQKERRNDGKISKTNTTILFEKELKSKKIKSYFVIGVIAAIFAAIIVSLNLSFNHSADVQTAEIASQIMKNESYNLSQDIKLKIDEDFDELKVCSKIVDQVSKNSTDFNAFLDKTLTTIKNNSMVDNPGILDENGYLHLADGSNILFSTSEITKSLNNKQAIVKREVNSFSNMDAVVFGYPYEKTISDSTSGDIKIVGLLSIFDIETIKSSLLYSSSSYDQAYMAIVDNSGLVICSEEKNGFDYFDGYYNILNCFKDNSLLNSYYDEFKNVIYSNDSTYLKTYNLNKTDYIFYVYNLGEFNWNVVTVVPFDSIYAYFNKIVYLARTIMNILTGVALIVFVILIALLIKNKIKLFTLKNTELLTHSINEKRFLADSRLLVNHDTYQKYYICYFDISHFKWINNEIGNEDATKILVGIFNSLVSMINENELICHQFSDRFVMLLKCDDKKECYKRIGSMIKKAKSDNGNEKVQLKFKIGLYFFEDEKTAIYLAIDRARTAASVEKIGVYNTEMLEKEDFERYVELSKDDALANHKFMIYYQAKYDLHNKRFGSCESLVRWKDDEKGFINTQAFVDIFEKDGFIKKLDIHLFERTLQDICKWKLMGYDPLPVSVNISRKQFDNQDFIDQYTTLMKKYNVEGKYIEFEFTESTVFDKDIDVNYVIDKIHAIGSKVAIDDFGKGYSNLSLINNIRFDILKIDRSVIYGINGFDDYSKELLKMIISLCKSMKKEVVCEGIEELETVNYLESIGCDYIQGYYFAKPLPQKDYEELVYGKIDSLQFS